VNSNLIAAFLCFFTVAGRSFSQATPNLPVGYAYSREILHAVRPTIIADENGNTAERVSQPSVQYFIYIVTAAKKAVTVKSVWADRQSFSFTQEKINTPVLIQNETPPGKATDTLVAFTKKSVWQLQLKDVKKEHTKKRAPGQLINKNALVIEYDCNGKAYLLTIKEIKKLPSIALQ
jgi:hypothetical protein